MHRCEEAQVEGSFAKAAEQVNTQRRGLLIGGSINQPPSCHCSPSAGFVQVEVDFVLCSFVGF